ncbi:unnamed protein product [Withania somnifera]
MAGGCITPPPFTTTNLLPRKSLLLACALTTPRPRKLSNRKNYLRPKILKTTSKPPKNEPLETPIQHTPIVNDTETTFYETPLQQTHIFPSDIAAGDQLKTSENQQLRLSEVSDPSGAVNATAGTFGKGSMLKFGLWVVGAFVFQTVCAVWILGSADYSGKNKILDRNDYKNEVLDLDLKSKSKYKLRMFVNGDGKKSIENGGAVFVDEAEMEKKIEEIRHMAREAREKERLERKGSDIDEEREEENEDSDVKMGIKKEVDERLIKLRKRIGQVRNKQPTNSVTYPTVDFDKNVRDDGGNLDEKEPGAALMFKRKQKFREFASKPSNKPKGFMDLDHQSVGTNGDKTLKGNTKVLKNGNREGGVDVSGNDEVDLLTLDSHGVASGENIERKGNTGDAEPISPLWVKKSSENKESGRKERSAKNVEARKVDVIKVGKKNSLEKSRRKKKELHQTWRNLNQELAIRMRRGHDDEGPEGLFALKNSFQVNGSLSHTVTFEDRGDATNFCYLLQSFFEDLGDFSAEIVPLPVQVRL